MARRGAGELDHDGRQKRSSDGGDGAPKGPREDDRETWVRTDEEPTPKGGAAPSPNRRERSGGVDLELLERELTKVLGATRGQRASRRVADAARAFSKGRLDEARAALAPIATEAPGSASVRELYGLTLYQLGRWKPAVKELEAFREITRSVDQNPVLADCYRALGRHDEAEALWDELREVSPSPELMAEGRIVAAGSLADRGLLQDAIRLLEAAPHRAKPRPHHLRVAYALADLRERAGDHTRARELFGWVAAMDPDFADVGSRVAALR